MTLGADLQAALEHEEARTVSDAFGGVRLPGAVAPSFRVDNVGQALLVACKKYPADPIATTISSLDKVLPSPAFAYTLNAAIRFAFLIELTNVSITSTKMKTRWVPGKIVKTAPGTFNNYRGDFRPGDDQRAATFDVCFQIFSKTLTDLLAFPQHLHTLRTLSANGGRSVSYEFVCTYVDPSLSPVHQPGNVRLVNIVDIDWLTRTRHLVRPAIPQAAWNKIKTKSYLTDRAQTGVDQTNRAKRWEVLSSDFQHATLEQCWSVERKLLSDLVHFLQFPPEIKGALLASKLFPNGDTSRCPITLRELDYQEFTQPAVHGVSDYQVGHMKPLKKGGRHEGGNVAWVTEDGNRIQGDLELSDVRQLITTIAQRMVQLGIQ